MKVIVAIPALNEATRIGEVVCDCRKFCDVVVVCDDGSGDETASVAKKAGAVVMRHAINCGKGAATVSALSGALKIGVEGDIFVTLDGDGQHFAEDIVKVVEKIKSGADMVNGSRFLRQSTGNVPWVRRVANKIGNLLTFIFVGVRISDSQTGFRAYSRRFAEVAATVDVSGYGYESEVLRVMRPLGPRIVEVPIRVRYDDYSMANGQNMAHGIRMVFKMMLQTIFR